MYVYSLLSIVFATRISRFFCDVILWLRKVNRTALPALLASAPVDILENFDRDGLGNYLLRLIDRLSIYWYLYFTLHVFSFVDASHLLRYFNISIVTDVYDLSI